jgi:hypothetical protein
MIDRPLDVGVVRGSAQVAAMLLLQNRRASGRFQPFVDFGVAVRKGETSRAVVIARRPHLS